MSGPPGEGRDEDRAGCRRPQPAGSRPAARSGVLDREDLDLEDALFADEDAAGLERGVPGDAVVLAADGDRAVEADALVAERVLRGALEREWDGDRLRHVLDGQV